MPGVLAPAAAVVVDVVLAADVVDEVVLAADVVDDVVEEVVDDDVSGSGSASVVSGSSSDVCSGGTTGASAAVVSGAACDVSGTSWTVADGSISEADESAPDDVDELVPGVVGLGVKMGPADVAFTPNVLQLAPAQPLTQRQAPFSQNCLTVEGRATVPVTRLQAAAATRDAKMRTERA